MEELFGAGAVAWGLGVLSDCAKAGTTEKTARKTSESRADTPRRLVHGVLPERTQN